MPSPMIRTSGSPCGEPWSSTSSRMPLARSCIALRLGCERAGLEEPAPGAARVEGLPVRGILRQPVGDRVERDRVHAHAHMARMHADVLGVRAYLVDAAAPGDDAVG